MRERCHFASSDEEEEEEEEEKGGSTCLRKDEAKNCTTRTAAHLQSWVAGFAG